MIRKSLLTALLVGASWLPWQAEPAHALEDIAFRQALIESAESQEAVAGFYQARNFAPFWTEDGTSGRDRLVALSSALETAADHGLPPSRFHAGRVAEILQSGHTESDRGRIEAEMSQLLIDYAKAIDTGLLRPASVDGNIVRAVPYANPLTYLTGFEARPTEGYFHDLAPTTSEYRDLRRAMFALREEITAGEGLDARVPSSYRPGDQGAGVVALRNRLIALGYLEPTVTAEYDDTITAAVSSFQSDHNLPVDGVAGPATVELLNLSPEDKLSRVLVAMERERWMPDERGDIHIEVNLPDLHARVIENERTTFLTKVIIGRNNYDDRTPEFSDEMEHMVINPSWNVPWSIATESYLPQLRANSGAVSHLRVVDSRGRTVSRNRDFSRFTARTFPYRFVQPPGPRNALGQVKFMFPNPYAIYLHDTPERHLFNNTVRTHSAGCVRVHRPRELAEFLLARQMADPSSYYRSVRNSGRETTVVLDQNIPVHIIYRTAFSNEYGAIEFRSDIYGRDGRVSNALANEGVTVEAIIGTDVSS